MATRSFRASPPWLRPLRQQCALRRDPGVIRSLHFSAPFFEPKNPAAPRSRAPRPSSRDRAVPRPSQSARPHQQPPPPPPPPPREKGSGAAPIDTIFQQRKLPLVGAGFAALCIGLYASLLLSSYLKAPASNHTCQHPSAAGPYGEPMPPTGRPPTVGAVPATADRTDREEARQSATAFDKGLDVPERLMGITGLRKKLASSARGHVLEVAVGTGRNLAYYDWDGVVAATEHQFLRTGDTEDVKSAQPNHQSHKLPPGKRGGEEEEEGQVSSFTGVDISADMMSVARTRIRDAVPGLKKSMRRRRAEPMPEGNGVVVDILDSRVRLCIADAEQALPGPPFLGGSTGTPQPGHDNKYDTVIQTFGLCSVPNPERLLSNMASVVRPGSGRIVLLEHGRGWYDWVNGLLDEYAEPHFKRYGCWWNRDIERVVRDTALRVPGLEVVKVERPLLLQAGTTLLIELRVKAVGETMSSS